MAFPGGLSVSATFVVEALVTRDAGASFMPGDHMHRPPWWYWLQHRDLLPVVLSALVVVGFLSVSAWMVGHLVVHVLYRVQKAWDHP